VRSSLVLERSEGMPSFCLSVIPSPSFLVILSVAKNLGLYKIGAYAPSDIMLKWGRGLLKSKAQVGSPKPHQ